MQFVDKYQLPGNLILFGLLKVKQLFKPVIIIIQSSI